MLIFPRAQLSGSRALDIQHEQSEEKRNKLINEQKTVQEDLTRAIKMADGGSTRSAAAMNNREFNEIDMTELFMTASNVKVTVLKN